MTVHNDTAFGRRESDPLLAAFQERLLRHERKHLDRIERDGRLLFAIKYSWWTLRHGYHMNPYEVEARAAESKSP